MRTKSIVVLANSVKKSGRCLAGKELIWTGAEWTVGNWIRPVATPDGGEVPGFEMTQALGREPQLLEILEISLEGPVPQPDQPENWLLAKAAKWNSHGTMTFDQLPRLLDQPETLWGTHLRYVEAGYPQQMAKPASLYLIQPESFGSLRVWTEETIDAQGRHYDRHRRRATLRYRGTFHEFDITDPQLQARYYPSLPTRTEAGLNLPLRHPHRTAVCVSLTSEWHGRHYKIAAAFFEPPPKPAAELK